MTYRMVSRVAFSVFLLSSTTALAQQTSGATSAPRTRQGGKTVYDFDEVDILGRLKRPEGTEVKEPPELRFRRLLDLDESFIPQIVRSVDEF